MRAAATLRPCLCFRCVRGRNGSSLGFARGRGRGLGRGTREQHHQPPEEKKEKKAEEKEKASPEGGGVKAQMRRSVWATTRKAAPKLTNTPPCGAWCLRAGCAGWPLYASLCLLLDGIPRNSACNGTPFLLRSHTRDQQKNNKRAGKRPAPSSVMPLRPAGGVALPFLCLFPCSCLPPVRTPASQ